MSDQRTMEDSGRYQVPALLCDFENNREERLPCILVVDGSGSMQKDDAIAELNKGLEAFARALKNDPMTAMRVQVSVIRFGGTVDVLTDWTEAMNFTPPEVLASGETPMGEAVELAMRMVDEQLRRLKDNGISRKRPWIWLMSDGRPTDAKWQNVAETARQAQLDGKFFLYPVSVITNKGDESHSAILRKFNVRDKYMKIQGAEFEAFFEIVSKLSSTGSRQNIDDGEKDCFDLMTMQRSM